MGRPGEGYASAYAARGDASIHIAGSGAVHCHISTQVKHSAAGGCGRPSIPLPWSNSTLELPSFLHQALPSTINHLSDVGCRVLALFHGLCADGQDPLAVLRQTEVKPETEAEAKPFSSASVLLFFSVPVHRRPEAASTQGADYTAEDYSQSAPASTPASCIFQHSHCVRVHHNTTAGKSPAKQKAIGGLTPCCSELPKHDAHTSY